MANSSMFVLPTEHQPGRLRSAPRRRRRTSGRKPSRMREPAVVASPRVESMSLSAIGTPCSPSGPRGRARGRARASSPDAYAGRRGRSPSAARSGPGTPRPAPGRRPRERRAAPRALGGQAQRRERPAIGGTRNLVRGVGGVAQHVLVRSAHGTGSSSAARCRFQRVRRRRHAGEVELADLRDVVEDARELVAEALASPGARPRRARRATWRTSASERAIRPRTLPSANGRSLAGGCRAGPSVRHPRGETGEPGFGDEARAPPARWEGRCGHARRGSSRPPGRMGWMRIAARPDDGGVHRRRGHHPDHVVAAYTAFGEPSRRSSRTRPT